MDISITNRGVDVEKDVQDVIQEKVKKIDNKYKIKINDISVVLEKKKFVYHVEVRVQAKDLKVVGNGKAKNNVFAAIEEAVTRIDTQLKKHKEKVKTRKADKGQAPALVEDEAATLRADELMRVVVEEEVLQILSIEDAAKQMSADEEAGFLMFVNEENHDVNLIYRGGDGNFTVIQPVK